MLQHQTAASLGSLSAGSWQQPHLTRPCRPHCRRAAVVVAQAVNRRDLVKSVATRTAETQSQKVKDLNSSEIEEVVKALFDTIVATVAAGEDISIAGFGKFERRSRKARKGRNPKTGAAIEIAATVTPGFSAGKQFKDAVKAAHT